MEGLLSFLAHLFVLQARQRHDTPLNCAECRQEAQFHRERRQGEGAEEAQLTQTMSDSAMFIV